MLEVPFDIPTIKKLYPELNRCFGFTYEDISFELSQVYGRKCFNLTPEEKELANQCKSEDGLGVDGMKFALETNENIYIRVTEEFKPQEILKLCSQYFSEEDEAFIQSILFMSALLYRDRAKDEFLTDADWESEQYQKYIYSVRPDMLRLYILLNQPRPTQKHPYIENCREAINDITIKVEGQKPIHLKNLDGWFDERMSTYLTQYLGVQSIKEAERELNIVYGKNVGNKTSPILTLYIWGIYQLFQQTTIKSKKDKSVSNIQCRFIEGYIILVKLIDIKSIKVDMNNIKSRLKFFLENDYTTSIILDSRNYRMSPNNIGGSTLW